MKAATKTPAASAKAPEISIHAAREGGDVNLFLDKSLNNISIHAAREGGDCQHFFGQKLNIISIHAAREGGDHNRIGHHRSNNDFNPRRP